MMNTALNMVWISWLFLFLEVCIMFTPGLIKIYVWNKALYVSKVFDIANHVCVFVFKYFSFINI